MKKSLIILFLFFFSLSSYAQSIGLLELTNLTTLNPDRVNDFFNSGKIFRPQYGEEVNGFMVKHYQSNTSTAKLETVLTGAGVKTATGAILYTVSYVAANQQNVINMIPQTKTIGLKLSFHGADSSNEIFIYDNVLFHVVFKLGFNQATSSVDVTQKITVLQ